MSNLPPPPTPPRHAGRRNDTKSTSVYTEPSVPATGDKPTWKDGLKSKGKVWGKVAYEKSWKWSDQIGGKINNYAEKVGLLVDKLFCCVADVRLLGNTARPETNDSGRQQVSIGSDSFLDIS